MHEQTKFDHSTFFKLRLVYRNLVAERNSWVILMILGFFSLWGFGVCAMVFSEVSAFSEIYYPDVRLILASVTTLIPFLLIFVLLPVLIFVVDTKANPSRLKRIYEKMLKEPSTR